MQTDQPDLPPLIVLVGPTAIGKTATAVGLCRAYRGEIVSADSRQVYRFLDIGTAKPTQRERAAATHHLIDVVNPDETLPLAEFQAMAYAAVEDILDRERIPFLVGGSGQWVRAVVEGWGVPHVPPDYQLREQLEIEADRMGAQHLHARLTAADPEAAARIDCRNVRRVIRALEVYIKTGTPISQLQKAHPPPYRILRIGLTMPRELLYQRVDARIERMLTTGLLEEVKTLVERGYTFDLPSMSGLGYRQIGLYFTGDICLEESIRLMKKETRRFVRQQYNWFQLDDPAINWFDVSEGSGEAIDRLVEEFLDSGSRS